MVVDPEVREKVIHYPVRFLKRLPLGLSYPLIIEEIKRIYGNIPKPESVELSIFLWIDATGVGKPVVDLILRDIPGIRLSAVFLTGGEAKEEVNVLAREVNLPKAYLVSRLQVLLSCGRVHLPNNPAARVMKEELMNYQIKVNENASAQFGAFKVGTHDDLVTALGLACLCERATELPYIASRHKREMPGLLRGYDDTDSWKYRY